MKDWNKEILTPVEAWRVASNMKSVEQMSNMSFDDWWITVKDTVVFIIAFSLTDNFVVSILTFANSAILETEINFLEFSKISFSLPNLSLTNKFSVAGAFLLYLTNLSLVLFLLLKGLNNKEISKRLFISNHTTKAHVASIYKKLGVMNRVQAAIKSMKLGADKIFDLSDILG